MKCDFYSDAAGILWWENKHHKSCHRPRCKESLNFSNEWIPDNLSACPFRNRFQDNKAVSHEFDEMNSFPVETGQWILKGQLTQKHMFSQLPLVVSIDTNISLCEFSTVIQLKVNRVSFVVLTAWKRNKFKKFNSNVSFQKQCPSYPGSVWWIEQGACRMRFGMDCL